MTEDYQKICKTIMILYCENKQNKEKVCANQECSHGYCVCMDVNQLEFLVNNLQIPINADMDDSGVDSEFICQEKGKDYGLISCGEIVNDLSADDKKLLIKELISRDSEGGKKIISNIPIIQNINMIDNINERKTMESLCVFSDDGDKYLNNLLVLIIRKMIKCYLDGNIDEKDKLVDYVDQIFGGMQRLFEEEQFGLFMRKFLNNIYQYHKVYAELKDSRICIETELETLMRNVELKKRSATEVKSVFDFIFLDNKSTVETIWLYIISEKIAKVTNTKFGEAYHQFFEGKVDKGRHKIFEEVDSCLNCITPYNCSKILEKFNWFLEQKECFDDGEICDNFKSYVSEMISAENSM